MSKGREYIILPAFIEIFNALKENALIEMIENAGIPTPDLPQQILQAIKTYERVEDLLRKSGFALQTNKVDNPNAFWLDRQRLQRINERQIR